MKTLNALHAAKTVKDRLVEYCLEEHFVRDAKLQQACRAIWDGGPEEGGLMGDLWVEGTFPSSTSGATLDNRVQEGAFSADLCDRIDANHAFGRHWQPRSIQTESMDLALQGFQEQQKPAVVVTAGTGAGKTEAFLLPMLNELFSRAAEDGQGVSSIVLYPMNALVKDQVDRIHSWLMGQNQVRMFSYTGATPETQGRPYYPDGSRFSSRNEARGIGFFNAQGNYQNANGNPIAGYRAPEILVTNYSMLEHMLARPQDAVFFGRNLRSIVLDEAHLYRGNLAADIALLLRRIYLRCGVTSDDVLQFATSATIGGQGDDGVRQLREFAGRLFSKKPDQIHVIEGRLAEEPAFSAAPAAGHQIDCHVLHARTPPDEATLTGGNAPAFAQTQFENEWKDYCRAVFGDEETNSAFAEVGGNHISPVLHRLVPRSAPFRSLYHALYQNGNPHRLKLLDLAQVVFGAQGEREAECVRRLLSIGAIARAEPDAMPLMPNRVHTLFRAPEGLAFRFDPQGGVADTRIDGLGFVFSTSRKPSQSDANTSCASLSLCRCQDSGEWFFAGVEDGQGRLQEVSALRMSQDASWDSGDDDDGRGEIGDCIRFFKTVAPHDASSWLDPETGAIVALAEAGFVPLKEFTECPTSGVSLIKRARFFISSSRLTLSIIAESLLAEMPPLPGSAAGFRPAGGRRLIAFSDSRAEAARMGPTLQTQHEQQIFRAVIARVFAENAIAQLVEAEAALQELRAYPNPGPAIQAVITETEAMIERLRSGMNLDDLIQGIQNRNELRQIIDNAQRAQHVADADGLDAVWDDNAIAVAQPEFLRKRVAVELARRASWPGLTVETTGLIEVVYPGLENLTMPDAMGTIGTHQGRQQLEQNWQTFLELLCDEIRNRNGITVGDANTDRENHLGRWVCCQGDGSAVQLLPQRDHSNTRMGRFLAAVCGQLGWPVDWNQAHNPAARILSIAVDQIAKCGLPWIEVNPDVPGMFRLKFRELRFRIPLKLHRCRLTGQVWSRSLFGVAPSRSSIQLDPITAEDLDQDPLIGRRRAEWRNTGPDDVFRIGLWAEEHSAQLDIAENERLQNLFKAGLRNILSSTTTLELGIDIGGLSGVVMGNIPPGKANYLQRAGRAGRRADGSSLVCSFARSSPYERKAFLSFDQYISRDLPPPTIHLDREKIVLRHLHMYLLSEFMRGQNMGNLPRNFGKMGPFAGREVPGPWQQPHNARANWVCAQGYLPQGSLAADFLDYLADIGNEPVAEAVRRLCHEIGDLDNRWQHIIDEASTQFREIVEAWCERFNELGNFWNSQGNDEQSVRACCAVRREGVAMVNDQIITVLGDGLFIPRYGFPIDVMKLHDLSRDDQNNQNAPQDESKRFRLERDCTMAIREYVPGGQIIAGGLRLTSRGILKHWTGANINNDHNAMLQRGKWMTHGANGFEYQDGFDHNPGPQDPFRPLLFPKHGFTTARWERPERAYRLRSIRGALVKTDAFNGQQPAITEVQIIPGLSGWHREGGRLYALHQGDEKLGFAVCLQCGYTQCEEEAGWAPNDLPRGFAMHKSIFSNEPGTQCWQGDGVGPVARHQVLAARQVTDFLLVDFSDLVSSDSVAFTLSQALRLAGAELLHLDYREIRTLDPAKGFANPNGLAAVLYDSLAGGSGHVAELADKGEEWLKAAVELLAVEEAVTDEWRKREGIQRLLTTDIRDFDLSEFRPIEALGVLNDLLNRAHVPVAAAGAIPDVDEWNLQRIANGGPLPQNFVFRASGNVETIRMSRNQQDLPKNGDYCIVRHKSGTLDCGKWMFREMQRDGQENVTMFRLVGSQSMDTLNQMPQSDLPEVIAVEKK